MEFDKPYYVYDIPAQLNESLLLTRLSFRKTKTEPNPALLENIKSVSDFALKLSKTSAAFVLVTVSEASEKALLLDNIIVESSLLKDKISGSSAVAVMSVTLGEIIDNEIAELFKKSEYTKAVVLDAAASCIADKAMEQLAEHVNNLLNKDGFELGKFRISPGQADIPLTMQKAFYNKLSLEKLGVKINENLMLTPQKSVISLSGVFKIGQ